MMRTHDRQEHAGSRLLILATLGLAVALVYLLFGKLGVTPDVPVYAASPLLPPTLLAPPDTAVVSDTTPTLSWAASPPPATGYYLKVDGWAKNVGSATSGEPNPLIDGPHTWTVAAYDGLGNDSDDAPTWSFTVDATAPPPPALQSPSGGTAISDTTVMLEWETSAGAAGYRLNWNGTVTDVGDTTWHTLDDLDDGTYSWTVAAYDGVGNVSSYPTVWTLRVDTTPPAPPSLISPANGDTITDPTPTMQWSASAEASGYLLKLDGNETDVGDTTSWTAPLLGEGAHTWSVAAYDQVGNHSGYTGTWSVTVEVVLPVPPVLDYPEDGAVISDTTPTLRWEEVPGAVNYFLGWDDSLLQEVGDHLFYTVSAPEGAHTWRVASVNALGMMSDPSEPYSFTVDITPPPVPTLANPTDGSVVTTSTSLLSWVASPGAAGYYLRWDGVPTNVGDTTTYTATAADGTHTWTVAAYDPVGNVSAYADPWSLTVDTTPPSVLLTEPADGATEVALDAPLEIRFSEAVDTGTFAFSVSPDPGGWVETWSEGDQVVTLTHSAFAQSTTYTVTVAAAVDLTGLPMTGSYSWSFETETYSLYLPVVMRSY